MEEKSFKVPTELPADLALIEFVDWTLEISPEEYARRVLYFFQRVAERTIEEAMEVARVFENCTPTQALYIKMVAIDLYNRSLEG